MSDENKIDPKTVREQLGLAEDAADGDVIVALLGMLAELTQQYEAAIAGAAETEEQLANRTLETYANRIPEASRDYFREQLLLNREATIAVLDTFPVPAAPAPAPKPVEPPAPPTPLRNRLPAQPGAAARPDNPDPAAPTAAQHQAAGALRNRAHEIQRETRCSWADAWAAAKGEAKP